MCSRKVIGRQAFLFHLKICIDTISNIEISEIPHSKILGEILVKTYLEEA